VIDSSVDFSIQLYVEQLYIYIYMLAEMNTHKMMR